MYGHKDGITAIHGQRAANRRTGTSRKDVVVVDIAFRLDGPLALLALAILVILLARRRASTGPGRPEQPWAAWPPELRAVHPARRVA